MATATNLDPDTLRDCDELLANGRFATPEDAVREGLRLVWERDEIDQPIDLDALDPETRRAVEEGLADVEAGRVRPAEEVFEELLRELCAKL